MRGSAPSFGITTSITVKTFPAPPSVTIFQYIWTMTPSNAAKAVSTFQQFAKTNIPKEFGVELVLGKSNSAGHLYFSLTGSYYGAEQGLTSIVAPFLSQVQQPDSTEFTPGSYIDSVKNLGGGSLSTSAAETRQTFYAKSLMTPAISSKALDAFTNYLANQGSQTNLVNIVPSTGPTSFLTDFLELVCRNGSLRWDKLCCKLRSCGCHGLWQTRCVMDYPVLRILI